jgi:hypothetical protein
MTNDCWLCGKIHEGDCIFDDEYWSTVEKNRLIHEARNTCDLCGKFSERSEVHNACADAENYSGRYVYEGA